MLARLVLLLVVVVAALLSATELVFSGEPIDVAAGEAPQAPQQPQLVVDDAGRIHLAYGIGNAVYYAASADGKAFSNPVRLPGSYVVSLGMRRGPRIAVTGDAICVSIVGGKQGKGRDGDVLVFRSVDQGKTWSDATRVNDVPDSAREGLHAMTASREGKFCFSWLDLREKGTTIYAAQSTDGGKSWGKNVLVYRSPSGTVCQCCHPSVVYDNDGALVVMWRNVIDGDRDMYFARSQDGVAFSEAKKLGDGSWKLNACPMDGGHLAFDAQGSLLTTWRRDQQVFVTHGGVAERLLGKGMQPWCAATTRGAYIVWLSQRVGELSLQKPGMTKAIALAARASEPVIAANIKSGVVAAAWEAHEGPRRAIRCQVIEASK